MSWADRVLTIVVTATVTSAAWIVAAGSGLIGPAPQLETNATTDAGEAASPAPDETPTEPLLIPVQGVAANKLRDTYSDSRASGGHLHEAIDIMAPRGTPVIAAASGTIERLFLSKDGGNTIYLRPRDRRTIHYYAHLDRYAPGLEEGRQVARGERLGDVGSTGNASPDAPHLHFAILRTTPDAEWWEPATAINPYPLLTGR